MRVEFRPRVCSAGLPVTWPSHSCSVRDGPWTRVWAHRYPPPPHRAPPGGGLALKLSPEDPGTHAPPPKRCSPHPTPEKQLFGCRCQKTDLVKFLHSPGIDGGPCTSRLHFGRRQPGGGQCQTHSVLRRALLTAQVTSGARHPRGRVSLGANAGVWWEPGGRPGSFVGWKESQQIGTGVFPTAHGQDVSGTVRAAEVKKETAQHAWASRTFSHRPSRLGGKGSLGSWSSG